MPISFTPQQRLDITRRQIRITQENTAFGNTAAQLTEQKAALLNVDNANDAFYQYYRIQSDSYEAERRAMDGVIPSIYSDGTISPFVAGDLSVSAATPGSAGALFFPSSPLYILFIPKIVAAVNGMLNPTGTDARYELDILSNADVTNGLTQVLDFLLNGITGVIPKTTTVITPGFIANNIAVASEINFTVGDYIYVSDNINSGIYQINQINPPDLPLLGDPATLDVTPIFPAAVNPSIGASVKNTVPGFTNSERINLTSVVYQEILNHLTAKILSLISTEWYNKLQTQITNLGNQNDARSPQAAQITTALQNANAASNIVSAWGLLNNSISIVRSISASPIGAVRVSGLSTFTTTVPHGYFQGQNVTVTSVTDSSFNGVYSIISVTSTTFLVTNAGPDATSGSGTSTVYPKYSDESLLPIQNLESIRQSYIPTRVSEIITAVGNVIDNGNGTYGGVVNSTYYNRYKWLNNRINRTTGSARRFFDADNGVAFVNTMIASNTSLQNDYDAFFLTKAITQNEGEPIVFTTDVTGLTVSDTVTIVTETQPEISRTIINIYGNNQVQLSAPLPLTYLVEDIVRLFKTL